MELRITSIFLPFEATQILQIPLINNSCRDTIVCGSTKNGNYIVRQYCNAIHISKTISQNDPTSTYQKVLIWSKIWIFENLVKLNHLLWHFFHNIEPTKVQLCKKGRNFLIFNMQMMQQTNVDDATNSWCCVDDEKNVMQCK